MDEENSHTNLQKSYRLGREVTLPLKTITSVMVRSDDRGVVFQELPNSLRNFVQVHMNRDVREATWGRRSPFLLSRLSDKSVHIPKKIATANVHVSKY